MNNSLLVISGLVGTLMVIMFVNITLASAQPLLGPVRRASDQIRLAQGSDSRLFDRGSCELACRDRYRQESSWMVDRTQPGGGSDYLRCSAQCDTTNFNQLERSRDKY